MTPTFETVLFTVADDHVATITLNRPEVLNAFNQQMCDEFAMLWPIIREDDGIHAVVLRAAGDRAFSTGVDVKAPIQYSTNVWSQADPGDWLSPKGNQVWKPVVCAVQGMAAGGAFYWINESDIVICSPEATFFDPHVTYGLTAVLEPIGLTHRVPLGEALRMALMGLDERVSADRALAIGLVTEIVDRAELWERAHQIAAAIAAKPPAAVQGTVRAIWESLDVGRTVALQRGRAYTQIGNPLSEGSVDRATVARREFRIR